MKNNQLIPITLWYSIRNGGDGSASPRFFLTKEETEYDQENMYEEWAETCNNSIDSWEGSGTHQEAIENSEEQACKRAEEGNAEEESLLDEEYE